MRTTMTLGGELDIATTDEVRDIVKDSTDSIGGLFRRGQRRPVRRSLPVSTQASAAGATILNFGSPPSGSTWCLVDVVTSGGDDHTAVAGATGALYIGNSASPQLGMLLRPGQAIPGFWSFSKEVIFAHYGDDIFVSVTGAAANSTLSAVARIHQYVEDAIEAGSI